MVNYSDFVRALCKPGEAIIADLTPASAHLLHMLVGLAGELAELVDEEANVLEELGDACFFIEGSKQAYAQLTGEPYPENISWLISKTLYGADIVDKLLDAAKRVTIYAKNSPEELHKVVSAINRAELFVTQFSEHSIEEAQQHNREKLKKRYESLTYSNEAAVARADKNA